MPDNQPNSPSIAGQTIVVDPARPTGAPSATPSGATLRVPEFLSSKMSQEEFAALPESAQRTLSERARDVQEDYRHKTTELATQRRQLDGLLSIQQQLDDDPKLADHLTKAIKTYKSGKSSDGQLKDEWEQLKEEADKDGLKILDAIDRRFSHSPVMEKLDALSQQLSQVVAGTQTSRRGQLEQELAGISPEFKSLSAEHRDAVIRLGLQPSMVQKSARDLLLYVAPREAYEDASFAERTRKSTQDVEQARQLGGFPSVAGAPETPATTKDDWQDSRDPRFGPSLKVGNVISRVFGEVRRHMPGGV